VSNFSILAVSMAMAAILERSTLKGTISHGMIFLQGFIKFDQNAKITHLALNSIHSLTHASPQHMSKGHAVSTFLYTFIIL
jgi:hypothetical protein